MTMLLRQWWLYNIKRKKLCKIPTGVWSRRDRETLSITFHMWCAFSPSSIEGRKDACNQLMLCQGTLSSKEERTRPDMTLINVTGSDCKVLPNKQGESLPHEAPNEGQASNRLYPSAVPSGFINHEFFQSCKDDDNKQQTTSYCLVKSEYELWTDLVCTQAGWITAQFLRFTTFVSKVEQSHARILQSYGSSWGWTYWCVAGPNTRERHLSLPIGLCMWCVLSFACSRKL
jgi:hypothetical protein